MRRLVNSSALLAVFSLSAIFVSAQSDAERREVEFAARNRELEASERREKAMPIRIGSRLASGLDKASRKALDQLRAVDREDKIRYAEFLRDEKAGIFKLFPDKGCVEKNLVHLDGDCVGFVPDSNYFSFRTGKYNGLQHDIGFYRDNFISRSFLAQAILVSLGDEPLDKATLMHPALKFLSDFQPQVRPETLSQSVSLFSKGVGASGYHFVGRVAVEENTTYAIRKIDFRVAGQEYLTPSDQRRLRMLNYIRYEDRKDSIYVFRVVRKDDDGVVTVLWKQIVRKNAPTIKFQKGDKFPEFESVIDKE